MDNTLTTITIPLQRYRTDRFKDSCVSHGLYNCVIRTVHIQLCHTDCTIVSHGLYNCVIRTVHIQLCHTDCTIGSKWTLHFIYE